MNPETIRIAMWSGPRNISTAMMRSFGARADAVVIDEPFYAVYLAKTGLKHPMREEVLASQPQDWREGARRLLGPVPDGKRLFYQKHMTHHMLPEIGRAMDATHRPGAAGCALKASSPCRRRCAAIDLQRGMHPARPTSAARRFARSNPTSAATAINDKGQVVGISGDCGTAVGGTSAREAVIWERGRPRAIGNLGGIAWNTPMAINERGDVVGFSNVSSDSGATPNWRAFMWTKEHGVKDLGALEGYPLSEALGINKQRQVVGTSCTADFSACRAVIWIRGKIVDLNELTPRYTDGLYTSNDINDDGEIAGQALAPATEQFSAFWAIPVRRQRHD